MMHYINILKNKNHVISIDVERALRQNLTSIYDKKKKTLQKVSIEGTYLNITKAIYGKSTNSIILNVEK